MPRSRKNTDRNKNLLKYKQKHKRKKMPENQNQFQLPPTRQTPSWESNSLHRVTGAELEVFSELMDVSARAYQAYTNIINRGLLDGSVQIKHEKLNAEKDGYVDMTEEEAAPLNAQVQQVISQAKKIAEQVKNQAENNYPSQEGLPHLDAIVDPTGQEATTEVVQPEQAKIVTLDS